MEESPASQNLADSPLPGIASTSSHMRPNTCAAAYECFYEDRTMRSQPYEEMAGCLNPSS